MMQIKRAGLHDRDVKEVKMIRLPPGIDNYWVGELGSVNWSFPKGTDEKLVDAESVQLFYDWRTELWSEVKTVDDRRKCIIWASVKMEGELEVEVLLDPDIEPKNHVPDKDEARDIVRDMDAESIVRAIDENCGMERVVVTVLKVKS